MTTKTPDGPAAEPKSATSTLREQFLDARRAEILEAARGVFVDKGYDAASMQQIAKAARVSAGNIYRYFPNKEALIVAVCEACEIDDRAKFDHAVFAAWSATYSSPLGALFAMGDSAFAQFEDDDATSATMLTLESALVAARSADVAPAVEDQETNLRDALAGLVAAAQEAGELDRSVDARALGELMLSVVSGLRLLQLQTKGDVDAEGVWSLLQRFVRSLGIEGVSTDLEAAQ